MKFSILVPAFKKQFLHECIESILSQTYQDFELIIVNDHSPEDLDSIVYSFNDSRIRYYINKDNCGAINVVDNWNICLGYATGDYVICMGDDDRLLPSCLSEYVKLMEAYPNLGVYHARTEIINEKSEVIRIQEGRPIWEGVYSAMYCRWDHRNQYIGDFLFDTNLLKLNKGFYKMPLAWSSDDISVYIAAQKGGIANMQVAGFQYRENPQTITSSGNYNIKLLSTLQEENWYSSFLMKKPKENDRIEFVYWRMLNERLSINMIKKRLYLMAQDMSENGLVSRGIFYLRIYRKLHFNFKLMLYAFILAIKNRYAHNQ